MSEEAIEVLRVSGAKRTDDGYYGLVRLEVRDGTMVLAFPTEELGRLTMASLVLGQRTTAEKTVAGEERLVEAFPVAWWSLNWADDGGFVLSFDIEKGGSISLQLGAAALEPLRQALAAPRP